MAKSKKTDKKSLEEILKELDKKYGDGSVLHGEIPKITDVISTGSLGLDIATGIGGIPISNEEEGHGKIVELRGWESCIDKDTTIKYIVINLENGIVQDCKGQSIENLYNRFHNRGEKTKNSEFYVMGINENDKVIRNPIADVVKTGEKECFLLKTESGKEIVATKEHKFYNGTNYIELKDLNKGDTVYIHNNTPFKDRVNRKRYHQTLVKFYYKGKQKSYSYYSIDTHRLIYEAFLNGINLKEYIELLNSDIEKLPDNWNTIPENCYIHHEDENIFNNDISNLVCISSSNHSKLHSLSRKNNLRFIVIEDKIYSIEYVGIRETYDIKCYYPYNNYIAAGIVVHNSGKSTLVQTIIGNAQRKGLKVLLVDSENSIEEEYAKKLGVDLDDLYIIQLDESAGEGAYEKMEKMVDTGEIGLVVIDSYNALQPKKIIEDGLDSANMGLHARMMSKVCAKVNNQCSQYGTTFIFIGQYREKIGVMFGPSEVTQGGNALKFYTHMVFETSRSTTNDNSLFEGDSIKGNKIGNLHKVKVLKNKLSSPFKKAQYNIIYGEGIDKYQEIIDLGHEYEVGKLRGNGFTYKEVKYEVEEFKEKMKNDEKFFQEIRKEIFDIAISKKRISEKPMSEIVNNVTDKLSEEL